ncbi:MAG: DUF2851 family protein [Candidatus Neomarinimicrobiota bacterium]
MGTIYYRQFTPYLELFEPRSAYVSELRLQHAWKQFLWKKELKDDKGRSLRVLSAGRHNHSDGPDFLDASLMINGKLCTGDIEIHFRASDWYAHKHHLDHRYNNCILHVVFQEPESSARARTEYGAELPVCYIPLDNIYEQEPPGTCRIFKADPEKYFQILKKKGWDRVKKKIKYFYTNRSRFPLDVMLYWGLFKASGYRYNEENMIKLFLHFPWAAYCDDLLDKNDIRPMLEDLAGFSVFSEETQEADKIRWTYSRTRPPHFPERRIAWLGELMKRFYHSSLSEILYDNCKAKEDIRSVSEILFDPHLPNVPGVGMRQEILLNAVMPLFESMRMEEKENEPMRSLIKEYIEKARIPHVYGVVERFHDKHGIAPNVPQQRSWLLSQGVLAIHDRYCSQGTQLSCPICLLDSSQEGEPLG